MTDIRRDTPAERMRLKLALADTIVIDGGLSDLERRVALRLLSGYLHFRTLRMWPGVKRLATELGVQDRSVKRALARLCGPDGYFRRVPGTGRGPGKTTVYEARWDRAFEGARVAKERLADQKKGTGDDTKGDRAVTLKGDRLVTQSLREETSEKPRLLDTPRGGEGGVGGEGATKHPPDHDRSHGDGTTKDARQRDQPEPTEPDRPKSKLRRYRASGPLPPGPGMQAAREARQQRDDHELED